MATEVITKTMCDSCKREYRRPGAEGDIPPIGWFELCLTERRDIRGWTNAWRLTLTLCPVCASSVRAVVGRPVVQEAFDAE